VDLIKSWTTEIKIYSTTASDIPANLKAPSKIKAAIINIYLTLLSAHAKLLNLKENIGISAISRKDKTQTSPNSTIGLIRI
jgi:hypothetical protein